MTILFSILSAGPGSRSSWPRLLLVLASLCMAGCTKHRHFEEVGQVTITSSADDGGELSFAAAGVLGVDELVGLGWEGDSLWLEGLLELNEPIQSGCGAVLTRVLIYVRIRGWPDATPEWSVLTLRLQTFDSDLFANDGPGDVLSGDELPPDHALQLDSWGQGSLAVFDGLQIPPDDWDCLDEDDPGRTYGLTVEWDFGEEPTSITYVPEGGGGLPFAWF